MKDPRFNMEIRGMQMEAESKLRGHPGARGRGSSVKVLLFKLFVMLVIVGVFFWWVTS